MHFNVRKKLIQSLSVLLILSSLSVFAGEPEGQVLGYYSHGSMTEGAALPEQGVGFVGLFRERNRYFGSQGLIDVIQSVAADLSGVFPFGERLQVGDISAVHGGFISGHASHQNGLDVDIAFFRSDYKEQPKAVEGFPLHFVKNGVVTSKFDLERNFAMAEAFFKSGRVNRMFVDPVIKNAMCDFAKSTSRWDESVQMLRRLRPLARHANHIHVRITCPKNSPKCEAQDPIPSGSGCDVVSKKSSTRIELLQAEIDSESLVGE